MSMGRPHEKKRADRAAMDAVRQILGLEPLYEGLMERAIEKHPERFHGLRLGNQAQQERRNKL